MENIENMDWEEIKAPENVEQEMKKIQKNLRTKNRKLVITSIMLALLSLWAIVSIGIPLVEKLYWNPEEITYKNRTDLETTLHAYTELFNPGSQLGRVSTRRIGFATYNLEITLYRNDWHTKEYHFGTLEKNELKLSQSFLTSPSLTIHSAIDTPNKEYFDRMDPWEPRMQKMLETLPGYMQVQAAVSFNEDIPMDELLKFKEDYPMVDITWVAIRTEAISDQWPTLCGMAPWRAGAVYEGMYKDYPYFMMSFYYEPSYLEQHFESLLRYSADQLEKGRGIAVSGNENYYRDTLAYIEENGIYSYGCVVTASPELLLELMNDERVVHMNLNDAWINVDNWFNAA